MPLPGRPPARRRVCSRCAAAAAVLAVAPAALAAAPADAAPGPQGCARLTRFVPAGFPATPKIDNQTMPLVPGTQTVLDGRSNVGGTALPHRVTFSVTDLTKLIDGVQTVVVYDVDYTQGQLAEAELSFWAQDNDGNVWNIGEYPEQYDHGDLVGAPYTWFAGISGAEPGIHAPAQPPAPGGVVYLQGYVPRIDFLDCAQTYAVGETTCVPAGCYSDVVVTDETSPLESRTAHQRKHYAPGVGIVQVGEVDDPQGETLVLSELNHPEAGEMARIDTAAMQLDTRGLIANEVYSRTAPAALALAPATATGPSTQAPVAATGTSTAGTPPDPVGRAPASLSLSGATQRLSRAGTVAVGVLCGRVGRRGCRGRIVLSVAGTSTRLGSARFAVPPRSERAIRVTVSSRGRRLIARRGRISVVAKAPGAEVGDWRLTDATTMQVLAP